MDYTPKPENVSQDSGYVCGSFENSNSICMSTPLTHPSLSTPVKKPSQSHKRKYDLLRREDKGKSFRDLLDLSGPATPPFSSTLNESIVNHFEKFSIEQNTTSDYECNHPQKYFKKNSSTKIQSVPSTPEKQIAKASECRAKSVGYSTRFSKHTESPLKESQDILYASIPKNKTPLKQNIRTPKKPTSSKKALFQEVFKKKLRRDACEVFSNHVIMGIICSFLSDGELYRFSKVSNTCYNSITKDSKAKDRLLFYEQVYRFNKENYKITPPNSPEKSDSPERSPTSRRYYEFFDLGKQLKDGQQLEKCEKCGHPSLLEKNVTQCTDLSCSFVKCKLCNSISVTGPENFFDKCGRVILNSSNNRQQFSELSNSKIFNDSSLNFSSGFYSDFESTPKCRRNLNCSFSEKSNVLSQNNKRVMDKHYKIKRTSSIASVDLNNSFTPIIENIEPSSPPKVKEYVACSKRSKRNLKRLTT